MNQKYRWRYGRFPFSEPLVIMFGIFCVFTTFGIFFERMLFVTVIINLFWIWRLSSPYLEKFYLDKNRFVTRKFKVQEIIDVPPNAVFVLSYTFVENSVRKKNSCMVNIINEKTEIIINKLNEDDRACEMVAFRQRVKNGLVYDSGYIEGIFKNKVVYSFVFDNETQQIFDELKRTVILPKSLESKVTIEPKGFDIIIDEDR